MTTEQLNIYNQAQRRVKVLKSNVDNLSTSISLSESMPLSVDLQGCKLDCDIGDKVLQFALDLCKEELIKAQKEFDEL